MVITTKRRGGCENRVVVGDAGPLGGVVRHHVQRDGGHEVDDVEGELELGILSSASANASMSTSTPRNTSRPPSMVGK